MPKTRSTDEQRRDPVTEARRESRRILARLAEMIEDSDLPHAEVEARLEVAGGYLRRLLGGRPEVRLRHLEAVRDALGRSPGRFYAELFPRRPRLRRRRADLRVDRDVLGVYGFALEVLGELHERLQRCEAALEEAIRSGRGGAAGRGLDEPDDVV